jgi:hypothetical protein
MAQDRSFQEQNWIEQRKKFVQREGYVTGQTTDERLVAIALKLEWIAQIVECASQATLRLANQHGFPIAPSDMNLVWGLVSFYHPRSRCDGGFESNCAVIPGHGRVYPA